MTLRPRVARPAGAAWNVAKTLAQTALMWAVFLFALPAAVLWVEARLGLADRRADSEALRLAGVVVFAACGAWGLRLGHLLAVRGAGTPLPFDTARRLVTAGSYAHVRNPMALASFGQGLGVAAYTGSPLVVVYVLCGVAIWNFVARPWEEADLVARFGAPYESYRRRVRCWCVRRRPYDPAREDREPPLAAARRP